MSWYDWPLLALGVAIWMGFGANLVRIGRVRFDSSVLLDGQKAPDWSDRYIISALKILGAAIWPAMLLLSALLMGAAGISKFASWLAQERRDG